MLRKFKIEQCRFVWASWDVNELSSREIRKRINEDPYYVRITMHGVGLSVFNRLGLLAFRK